MAYGDITITDLEEGSQIWTTNVAPTSPNYTFAIADLTGSPNATVKVGDVIMYESSTYNITDVGQTTVLASFLQDLKGADGQDGKTLYGTCSTAANVATKVVVCADATEVVSGLTIVVKFDNANTVADNIYLTVANETAQVYFNGSVVSSTNQFLWGAGASIQFVYNDTYWIPLGYPCSYYGACSTVGNTAAKNCDVPQVVICNGTTINIQMTNANTVASPTLNVSSTGSKTINANGATIAADSKYNWNNQSVVAFVFDGSIYKLSDTTALHNADEAKKIANNYLSQDNIGIMVADMTNGTMDNPSTIQSGKNVLVTAGYTIQEGNDTISIPAGVKIRDGQTVLASFGENIQLGEDDTSRLMIDYHSTQLVDKDDDTYFHVSDLRNASGVAELVDIFTGDGYTKSFSLRVTATGTDYSVTVSDSSGGTVTKSISSVTFSSAPTNGATITVSYLSTSDRLKAYTLGKRTANSACGLFSLAEGYNNAAIGNYSHTEGYGNSVNGRYSHAEGRDNTVSADSSHAEGYGNTVSKSHSHAEGYYTQAIGSVSHAEGASTIAHGGGSHAQNGGTIAWGENQTALGSYNIMDNRDKYAVIVGNGTDDNDRSNALTVDWDGNVEIAGQFTDGNGNVISSAVATTSSNGYMSASDKTKLNGIETGAEKNVVGNTQFSIGSAGTKTINVAYGMGAWSNLAIYLITCCRYNVDTDTNTGMYIVKCYNGATPHYNVCAIKSAAGVTISCTNTQITITTTVGSVGFTVTQLG